MIDTKPEPLIFDQFVDPMLQEWATAVHEYLWTFEWAYPDGQTRGELEVDTDHGEPRLLLKVWAPDNDDPDDRTIKELEVTRPIGPYPPAEQVRRAIHWYLCHEADEQMYSAGVRIFDPHCKPGQDRKVNGDYIRSEEHRQQVAARRQELGL
jgi:hypothetical protein